jgi:deoxyribonuclease V
VLTSACYGPIVSLYPPRGDEVGYQIWVVRHAWHTGLVVRRADVPADIWPERDDFPGAEYLEVGWGERDFYQVPQGTLWLGLKAAFWANDSVLHVAAFYVPPAVYFAGSEVAEIALSTRGFRALVVFIADAHARTGEGRAIPLGPGRYGHSRFYLGRERYVLTTCNVWTARALRAGGLPMTPFWALTAANVMFQVESGRASPRPRRRWPRTVAEAARLQARLRRRLRLTGGPRAPHLIAGADVAYRRDGRRAWAAVVLVAWPGGVVVESAIVAGAPAFPYVPGYLAFREGPLLLTAFDRLGHRPDLCLFDGHGLAHPRRFGLACHLGVLLDLPSVGCAKSLLVGDCREPGRARGAWTPIRLDGNVVGAAVRTRAGVKPLVVSPGHRLGLRAAVRWALACSRFRLPEPIRLAEQLANRARKADRAEAGRAARIEPAAVEGPGVGC